jgi:hypothetical protein
MLRLVNANPSNVNVLFRALGLLLSDDDWAAFYDFDKELARSKTTLTHEEEAKAHIMWFAERLKAPMM